jgi:hypothetical protein
MLRRFLLVVALFCLITLPSASHAGNEKIFESFKTIHDAQGVPRPAWVLAQAGGSGAAKGEEDPISRIQGIGRFVPGDPRLRIAELLLDVKNGRTGEYFYKELGRIGKNNPDINMLMVNSVKTSIGEIGGDMLLDQFLGRRFEGRQGTPVEALIGTYRRDLTNKAIAEVIKDSKIRTLAMRTNSRVFLAFVGKWASQSPQDFTFSGDIDFSFVGGNPELIMAMRDLFDAIIVRETGGLTMKQLDSFATAHGYATSDVYRGEAGRKYGDDEIVKGRASRILFDQGRYDLNSDTGAEAILQSLLEESVVEASKRDGIADKTLSIFFEKLDARANTMTEPMISMEMIRHLEHDIILHSESFPALDTIIKGSKYLYRSNLYFTKQFGVEPSNKALSDFATKMTQMAKSASPGDMAAAVVEYFKQSGVAQSPLDVDYVSGKDGKPKAILKSNREKAMVFLQDCMKNMWGNVQRGLQIHLDELKRKKADYEEKTKRGTPDEQTLKDMEAFRKKLSQLLKGIKTEMEEFETAKIELPSEVKSLCQEVVRISEDIGKITGMRKLTLEEEKQLEMIKKLLEGQPAEHTRAMALSSMMDLANKFIQRTNARLDWIDDTLMGPFRGDPPFEEFIRDIHERNKLLADLSTIDDPAVKARIAAFQGTLTNRFRRNTYDLEVALNTLIYKNAVARGVKKVNVTINEFIQSSQSGRAAMAGLTAFNLVQEFSAYTQAFSRDGFSGFAAEIIRRRVPFGSTAENLYQGKCLLAGWTALTTIVPPLALPEAAYGVVSYATTAVVSYAWSSDLELLIDGLYDTASWEEVNTAGVMRYKLAAITYKSKKYERQGLEKGEMFILQPDVDMVLWANLAQDDPFLELFEGLQNHEAAGQKVKDSFVRKYEERWLALKKAYVQHMIEKLEKRKNAEEASGTGKIAKMYDELMDIAGKLEIKSQINAAMDAEWDSDNLKALWGWLKNAKRAMWGQPLAEKEATRAAAVVMEYLEKYRAVLAARTQVESAVAGVFEKDGLGAPPTEQHRQRILTGIVFLTGRAGNDEETAKLWKALAVALDAVVEQELVSIKAESVEDARLDSPYDRETHAKVFFEDYWIKALQQMKVPVLSVGSVKETMNKRVEARKKLVKDYRDHYALAKGTATVYVMQQHGSKRTALPVINAEVTLKAERAEPMALENRGEGQYTKSGFNPGTYILTVRAEGFTATADGKKDEASYTVRIPSPKESKKALDPITVYLIVKDRGKQALDVSLAPATAVIKESGEGSTLTLTPIVVPKEDSGRLNFQWVVDGKVLRSGKDVSVDGIVPISFSGQGLAGKNVKVTLVVFDEKDRQGIGESVIKVVPPGLNVRLKSHRTTINKDQSEIVEVEEPRAADESFKYSWKITGDGVGIEKAWSAGYTIMGSDYPGQTLSVTVTVTDKYGSKGQAVTSITVMDADSLAKIPISISPQSATISEDGQIELTVSATPFKDSGRLSFNGVALPQGTTSYRFTYAGKDTTYAPPVTASVAVTVQDEKGRTGEAVASIYVTKKDDKKDDKKDGKKDDKKDGVVVAPVAPDKDKADPGKTDAKYVPACSYTYSAWGECSRATKKQTRTVTGKEPQGCVEKGKPALEQGCTPPPTEEDKRNQYFNCLCRCSSGWAGHIGVWYDPEGKSEPECKSSGPCFGGAGAWGCTRRHFFVGPNDCGKGCWEAAFGKDTYDPKKADDLRKNENKKYKKPLTVKINPSKNPADFGDIITLQAEAGEGSGGYSFKWGGCAQDAKDAQAKVANTRDCKPCEASVTVTDQDGDSASGSVTIQCNTVKVKLTKESPKENTVPVGGKATFYAEVFSGDKPFSGPTLIYVWERNPDAIFGDPKNPRYETSAGSQTRNTATFRKAGTTPVWVIVQREIDGKKVTIGESEQIPITVANPELSIKVAPEKPNIGQEVKLQVESKPAVGDDIIGFWWEIPGYWTGTGNTASFKPKDTKPVKVTVHAKTKDGGDEVGTKEVTITAQSYQVSIGEPRYLESPPQVWRCDTQLGQAQHCGMVTLKPNEFAVFRDVFLKATVAPQPESPRYKWTVGPSGSCGSPGAGSEIKLNCSNTGTYTVKLEVTNADGAKLGEASQSVSVSVSQSDLNNSKNAKDAYDKLQKAKGLVAEGKLDEGIALANEAAGLDPKNAEAKSLAQKWGNEKQTVTQQLDKTKKLITENQFDQAEKEFAPAQKLHPKYPPVVETDKLLKTKKDEYKKNVAGKLADAKTKARKGDYDGAIKDAEDAAKFDPANKEAAGMADKLRKEKDTIHQQIDKAKKLMDENKFPEAQKELSVASNLNGYYPPVPAANKELGDRWGKYNNEVRDKVYEVRSANEKKDFGKALEIAAAWRAATKLDPYAEQGLKQQEDWAKQWKAQKDRQIGILKAAGEKVKTYDYAGALKQYDEGFANGQNIYNGSEPEYKEAVELRGQAFTKNKRLNELIPWVQRAAESKESMPADTFQNAIKSADEAIALQPNNEQLKKWREQIAVRAEKTKEDSDRTAQGRKCLEAAGNAERSFANNESYVKANPGQWGEKLEEQQQTYLTTAIQNYGESLKYIPDATVEKKIKDLQATLEGRKKYLEQYRQSRTLMAEADALYKQATQDPDIQSASPKYDEAAAKYKKSLSLYRPFNAENIEKTIYVLETYKHERWVKKYWADGQELEKQGKLIEALAAYDKAIASLHPTTDQRSRLWYETQAQELRNKINGAKTWRADGEAKQKAGKIAEAIASYKQSLALLPDAALAEHVRMLEGKQAEAGDKKATADKLWQEGTALFNQGRPSDALAKFKESFGYYTDATRTKYVADMEARRAKAVALREEGAKLQQGNRIPEAIAKYKESLSYWPDSGLSSHIATLEGKLKQDNDTAARKARAKQLRDEGYALQQKNQPQAAIGKYRESLAILPDKQLEDYIRQLETKIASKPVTIPQTTSTPTVASATTPTWTGTWRSENRPEDPADFVLNQSGNRITGTYTVNATVKIGTGPAQNFVLKGRIEGTVTGNTLRGTYTDADDTKTTGQIELVMNPDGNSCRVNIRNEAANENWTARRVSSIGGSSSIGSPATRAAATTSIAVQYINGSQKNCHIFPDGDSFGPGNRLTPGEMRSVTVKTRSDGSVTFKAGRDGSVLATKSWGGGVQGGKLMVVFDDRNQLTVSPAP